MGGIIKSHGSASNKCSLLNIEKTKTYFKDEAGKETFTEEKHYKLSKKKSMPTPRFAHSAVCLGRWIFVAGGLSTVSQEDVNQPIP